MNDERPDGRHTTKNVSGPSTLRGVFAGGKPALSILLEPPLGGGWGERCIQPGRAGLGACCAGP